MNDYRRYCLGWIYVQKGRVKSNSYGSKTSASRYGIVLHVALNVLKFGSVL